MKIPRNKAAKGKQSKARNKSKRSAQGDQQADPVERSVPKVWQPGDEIGEDEALDFDPSAYDCMVRFTDTWPSLSFDIVADASGGTADFPHDVYFISGTQAPNVRDNYLSATKVKQIQKFKHKKNEHNMDTTSSESDSSSSSSDEEVAEKEKEKLYHRRIRHAGGVNRVRCMSQDPRIVAVWSESGLVQVFDMTQALNDVHGDQSTTDSVSIDPVFTHNHPSEGFALDWSKVKRGLLASGDCASHLNVWQPTEDGRWNVVACTSGHTSSVEDIQWSPTEETVFASASVDKTIRIWDSRETNGARLTVEASTIDVNVLSWNKGVTYMLASGDDCGVLKIWDLRQFSNGEAIAEFNFHKESITSVEWCPHESSMLATSSDDNQIAIWDLALERDPEEEAQFVVSKNAQLSTDIPPQLLFLHSGQRRIKELHWHPQIQGMIMSTAEDGMNIFKSSNT